MAPLTPAEAVRRVAEHQVDRFVELGEQVGRGLEAELELKRCRAGDDQQQPCRLPGGALDGPHGAPDPVGPAAAAQAHQGAPDAVLPAHIAWVAGNGLVPGVAADRRSLLTQGV